MDAPAGTLVYLDDPKQTRHAVATEPGTTVLALGGVPGRHEPSTWEYFFPALPLMREGRYAEAKAITESGFEDKPDHEVLLYHLARTEAALGERDAALEHLNAALAKSERLRGYLADEHFDSIRDDPHFPDSK